MSPADQRVAELLDRWLASVDLHARYLSLDDAAYARVQEWPAHARPTRWVVDLARTRLLELKKLLADRHAAGDAGFAEALELMGLLTNLLGSEHLQRFIPLAQPVGAAAPDTASTLPASPAKVTAAAPPPAKPKPARPPDPTVKVQTRRRSVQPPVRPAVPVDKATATVIADAVRLLSWGREWPQLASLIARMADRPPEAEILKILRKHRTDIEAQARRPRD
jgi:hypothetical protein